MAGTNKELDALHRALVEYLTERLHASMKKDDDGNIIAPMPAAELSVLRQFLKDNGIAADKGDADDLLALQAQLDGERTEAERKSILNAAISKIADDSEIIH